jgi:AcrR family transcriptional regulator
VGSESFTEGKLWTRYGHSMGKIRSTSLEEKEIKRTMIIKAAFELLNEDFEKLPSISEVAKKAGVAKGTVYTYFETKEELFLAVLLSLFHEWAKSFKFETNQIESFLHEFVDSLLQRPVLLKLASKAPVVLERNVSEEVFLNYRKGLARLIDSVAEIMKGKFEAPQDNLRKKVVLSYNVLIGVWQNCDISDNFKNSLNSNNLEIVNIDFRRDGLAILKPLWGLS